MPPQNVRAEPFSRLTPTTQIPVRFPFRMVPGRVVFTVVFILHLPDWTEQAPRAKSFRLMTVQAEPPQSSVVARTEAARVNTCPLQLGSRLLRETWRSMSPSSEVPGSLSGPFALALARYLPLPLLRKKHFGSDSIAGVHAGKRFEVVLLPALQVPVPAPVQQLNGLPALTQLELLHGT